jgi:hypothetical protein
MQAASPLRPHPEGPAWFEAALTLRSVAKQRVSKGEGGHRTMRAERL